MLRTNLLFGRPPLWITLDLDFLLRPDVCFVCSRLRIGALGHHFLPRCRWHHALRIHRCGGVRILGPPIKVSADARLSFCSRVIFSWAGDLVPGIVRRCGGTECLVTRRRFLFTPNLNARTCGVFYIYGATVGGFYCLFYCRALSW